MIGLLFLAGIGLWVMVAVMLARRIPGWLGVGKHRQLLSVASFSVILVAPVADELIGRWQFHRLCEREAVVTLSPDWERVRRAKKTGIPIAPIGGYAMPIEVQRVEYVDVDTGRPFLTLRAFHTDGGVLFGRLGLGLGKATSCWPKDWVQVTNQVNVDQLLKGEKAK